MQAQSNAPARRIKVARKGYSGIYYRDTPAGRRYEITFLDRAKRRRWETVEGSLEDAAQLLAARKAEVRENKHVAPSDATFDEAADEWLRSPAFKRLGERTRERYGANLEHHLRPRFGARKMQSLDADDVVELLAALDEAGKAGWTQRNVLTTLSALFRWASGRRKLAATNPVRQLEKHERPKVRKRNGRTLQPKEITALIDSATTDRYRVLLATAVFTGLRLMELLALRWMDVDYDAGEIRVRKQLTRKGGRLEDLKSESGAREIALRPELVSVLRAHRMASKFKQPSDFVFASETGGPLGWRNVERRAMDAAFEQALETKRIPVGRQKPVMHDARHTFGSMLVAEGRDVYTVSRQMGHANVSTTLNVYTGEFDKARNADPNTRRPNYGNVLETAAGFRQLRGLSETASLSQLGAS
jgi:integrase